MFRRTTSISSDSGFDADAIAIALLKEEARQRALKQAQVTPEETSSSSSSAPPLIVRRKRRDSFRLPPTSESSQPYMLPEALAIHLDKAGNAVPRQGREKLVTPTIASPAPILIEESDEPSQLMRHMLRLLLRRSVGKHNDIALLKPEVMTFAIMCYCDRKILTEKDILSILQFLSHTVMKLKREKMAPWSILTLSKKIQINNKFKSFNTLIKFDEFMRPSDLIAKFHKGNMSLFVEAILSRNLYTFCNTQKKKGEAKSHSKELLAFIKDILMFSDPDYAQQLCDFFEPNRPNRHDKTTADSSARALSPKTSPRDFMDLESPRTPLTSPSTSPREMDISPRSTSSPDGVEAQKPSIKQLVAKERLETPQTPERPSTPPGQSLLFQPGEKLSEAPVGQTLGLGIPF